MEKFRVEPFSLNPNRGLGCCSLSPVYVVGTVTLVPEIHWSERSHRIYVGSEKRVNRARAPARGSI